MNKILILITLVFSFSVTAISKETTFTNEIFEKSQLDGKTVVIHSWNKTCTTCAKQLKILHKAKQDFKDVIFLSFEQTKDKDIAKQLGKDVSTLHRWRKREDIQLAMGAISQQKYEDTIHRDALVMEKLTLSVFSKIDQASPKDVFWLYQSLSKKRISKNGPFPTHEMGMEMFKNQNTILGDDVSSETQNILDSLDFDIDD